MLPNKLTGHALKEALFAVHETRAGRDSRRDTERVRVWEEEASEGFYAPSSADLGNAQPRIDELIRSGKLRIIIPMRETSPEVPNTVLRYLIEERKIPREFIMVSDQGSDRICVQNALEWGVQVLDVFKAMESFSPEIAHLARLSTIEEASHILRETGRQAPMLHGGKGINVLAACCALRAQLGNGTGMVDYVLFHDSDFRSKSEELGSLSAYDPVRHLLYPIVHENGSEHNQVLTSQVGRGNEAVYAARVALKALELAYPDRSVRKFIASIRPHLLKRVWICCGEFVISWHDLSRLPLASAFVMETILAFGIEGINLVEKQFSLAQLINQNPRMDACNGAFEEQRMMGHIATAITAFAMMGKPPHMWTIDDIDRLNGIFSAPSMDLVEAMPERSGPAIGWEDLQDRILPSTQQIFERDWVHWPTMRQAIADSLPTSRRHPPACPHQPHVDSDTDQPPAQQTTGA